jgi:formylglycine-generating enzyme required for sulfatase activity
MLPSTKPLILLLGLMGCAGLPSTTPRSESVIVPGTRIPFEMVYVPGGRFKFGNRDVDVQPYWISKREVTWAEFDRFYEYPEEQRVDGVTRPSSGKSYLGLSGLAAEFMEGDRPVTNLRYHSTLAYCEWLSRRTGMIFRLPTEVEWEFACGLAPEADQAWNRENSGGRTHPGGRKKANNLGLFDLLGNVWEYCLEPDSPPDFGPVLRGGAWNTPPGDLRRTIPLAWEEVDPNRPFSTWWFRGDHSQGFRVVRLADTGSDEERKAYASKIEISGLKGVERVAKIGTSVALFTRVTGEVRNGGDRALDELLLKVYVLTPGGKPHFEDVTSNLTRRATFNVCAPVLPNSAHPGEHTRPLQPGERRNFTIDLPMSLDGDADVDLEKFGASVLHLKFH